MGAVGATRARFDNTVYASINTSQHRLQHAVFGLSSHGTASEKRPIVVRLLGPARSAKVLLGTAIEHRSAVALWCDVDLLPKCNND